MSLVILTKSPQASFTSAEVYRKFVRKLFRISRGPDGVVASLLRGLNDLKQDYLLNPNVRNIKTEDVIFVNDSIDALKWAIKSKRSGLIFNLIAGPNLVVLPSDFDGIINSPEIDMILQPSEWVRDLYVANSPVLDGKIMIWPAGVALPSLSRNQKKQVLVYIKCKLSDTQMDILDKILSRIPHRYIYYGKYKQAKYFEELDNSIAMLYFSSSESQGLALLEAWARDVPTLVLDNGIWEYHGYIWKAEKIGAPYLNDLCGLFFNDIVELHSKINQFFDRINQYHPRDYVIEELSDKRSAEKFLMAIHHL